MRPDETTRTCTVRCTNCRTTDQLRYDLIDGREPDSKELRVQIRQKLNWKANEIYWRPREIVACSQSCADLALAALQEVEQVFAPPIPTQAPQNEQERLKWA